MDIFRIGTYTWSTYTLVIGLPTYTWKKAVSAAAAAVKLLGPGVMISAADVITPGPSNFTKAKRTKKLFDDNITIVYIHT